MAARWAASAGLRQQISRSPGYLASVISAKFWSPDSDICSGPSSLARAAMAGARRAVIQPAPGSACSWRIRTLVTDPRSPTRMTSPSPNLSRTTGMISPNATESEVFPANTRIATGIPARLVTMPNSICSRLFFPSRECPNAPSGQLCPSSHADDKSNNARPPVSRCRAASFFSIASCRESSQSIAAYTSSVPAFSTPRSAPSVVSAHQRVVASFDAGATARAIISPYARSRSKQSGPSRLFSPSLEAITCAAATCPCGNDRSISNISPASTSTDPDSDAFSAATALSGSADRFASVSFFTFPPSRNERRSKCVR